MKIAWIFGLAFFVLECNFSLFLFVFFRFVFFNSDQNSDRLAIDSSIGFGRLLAIVCGSVMTPVGFGDLGLGHKQSVFRCMLLTMLKSQQLLQPLLLVTAIEMLRILRLLVPVVLLPLIL